MTRLSLIIPLYNRPDEIRELLESLVSQKDLLHEVIVVEDGSRIDAREIVMSFSNNLNTKYFYKDNSGPGQSRNYGAARATGDYFIFLDSDCVIPEKYLATVHQELSQNFVDAFGGPDRAHKDFTPLQKAINYAMTSLLTTGGIRGKKKSLDDFYPRSFNMGYTSEVYEITGGFGKMRFGEDIDMSIRILKNGFKTRLFPEAYVFHKRRSNFRQFYKQVYNSGMARIHLYLLHPGSLKLVHLLPSVFTTGLIFCLLAAIIHHPFWILPPAFYAFALFIHSLLENKNLVVAFLSIPASFIQLLGYGLGFIDAVWNRLIRKKERPGAFMENFYE
ncbi:MAG: glycosyltransferase [Cryomorphaceae bacterium]|nr:glycosyltransferase [Cryomorphaceae bacterium]